MFVKIGRINKPIFYYCYIHKKCKKNIIQILLILTIKYRTVNCMQNEIFTIVRISFTWIITHQALEI